MAKSAKENATLSLEVAWWVDSSQTYTVVDVGVEGHVGTGVAKRNPEDTFDEEVGFNLALKRALHDLAEEVPGE